MGRVSPLSPVPAIFDASGVFETCRVEKGKVLHREEHLRRLQASLKTAGIFSWDEASVRRELGRAAAGMRRGFVRVAVRRAGDPRFLVYRHPGLPYSSRDLRRGIEIRTVAARWPSGESSWAQAKLSERLGGALARAEAPESPDVLRLGPHGYLTEGTVSNLFFVKEGTLTTAPTWIGVLEGVTRANVIRAARRLKIPVRVTPFGRHDLFNAEETFLTNVLMGVLPVSVVDGRRIGGRAPGPVTRKLMREISGR